MLPKHTESSVVVTLSAGAGNAIGRNGTSCTATSNTINRTRSKDDSQVQPPAR